jgi:hypothetical protein
MKMIPFLLIVLLMAGGGCERKLSTAEVKENLEKAMTAYLRKQQQPGAPPLRFDMVDVSYREDAENYLCDFKVTLHRPDGGDTTGIIAGKVSKDFSTVSKR